MIGDDTPCKVIGIVNGLYRKGKPGVEALMAGRMLYYLWHEETKLYYIECYVHETYAIKKAAEIRGPRSMGDVAQSWRSEAKYCHHSWKEKDDVEQ